MAGAKKPKPIEITGGDGNIYVVDTWNRGTIADGNVMTDYTIRPICSAIQGGTSGLSAEIERAMAAEGAISSVVVEHYNEYKEFETNVIASAESLSAGLAQEISDREDGDDYLQEQIDTLKAATDVIMVYNTYSDFTSNSSRLTLTDNDVIKVLNDEERQKNQTYYQYDTDTSAWSFLGELDPYYSKSDLEHASGKNINITTDENGIHINTNDNVVFTTVTSNGFSGTNLSGATKHYTIDNLFGSAQSGAEASAYITAHSADFLNSAHSAYNKLTFKYGTSTTEYQANNSNYNFTFLAGQGVSFITGENQVTITAEGRAYTGENYIKVDNTTKKISVTGNLLTSAKAGSAASAWINNTLFDYSYYEGEYPTTASGSIGKITVLYKNDAETHDVMLNQEMVFEREGCSASGLLIPAAKSAYDNGKVLTYNSTANNYTWQAIPDSTYTTANENIIINNGLKTIGLATSISSDNMILYGKEFPGATYTTTVIINGEYISANKTAPGGSITAKTYWMDLAKLNYVSSCNPLDEFGRPAIKISACSTLPSVTSMQRGVYYLV